MFLCEYGTWSNKTCRDNAERGGIVCHTKQDRAREAPMMYTSLSDKTDKTDKR